MEVLYLDNKIIVCVKPAGVLSTDEPGGMPSLLRAALGDDTAPVYTVHRLDAAVSGVMVYARTRHAAADLGRAIERGDVRKEYLAVACGALPEQRGEPLWGDAKYGGSGEGDIALFSCALAFPHPLTGEMLTFAKKPPAAYPWTEFPGEVL